MIDHRAIRLELQKALTKDRFNPNLTPVQRTVTKHGTTYSQTYYVAKPKPKSANPSSKSPNDDVRISQGGKFQFGNNGLTYAVPQSSKSPQPSPKSPPNSAAVQPPPHKPAPQQAPPAPHPPKSAGYQKPSTSRQSPRKATYPGSFPDLAAAENVLGRKGDPNGPFEIWHNILTKDCVDAIYHYTGIFYKMMNGLARGTIKESDLSPSDVKLAKKYTDLLEQALNEYELKSDVVLHRQVNATDMLPKFQKAFASPDKLFIDEGFFSATPVMDSFNKFNGMDLIIKVPAGKGRGAWIKHLSRFPHENEFLLNNYSMFTVDDIKKVNGRWQVVLTWKGRMTKTN